MENSSEEKNTFLRNSLKEKSVHINSSHAWFVLSCAWFFYLYEFILRISPSVMTEQLMTSFNLAACGLGALSSFYYIGYVPLQIPCGIIVDHAGPRITVTFSAVLCAVGAILFASSDSLVTALTGRFLIGCGSACAYISCLKISSVWFDPSKFAFIAGTAQMISVLGGSIGNRPLANLVNTIGWQSTMFYAAAVGGLTALGAWCIIRDKPQDIEREKAPLDIHVMDGLLKILKSKQNVLIAVYGFLMNMIITTFAELWGIPFIMTIYGINNESASLGTTAVLLGFGLGSVLSAFISNYFKSYNIVMKIAALGTFIFFFIAIWVPISYDMMVAILFLGGFFSGMQILYFTAAVFHAPSTATATAVGFTNAFVTGSAIIFQPLLGKILEYFWDGTMKDGCVPIYSGYAYQYALSSILICSFLALGIMYFVQETYQKKA
jgi:sugar phosphate permease